MGDLPGPGERTATDPLPSSEPVSKELRRDYHDRVASVRNESIAIVADAVVATRDATAALLDPEIAPEKLAAITEAATQDPVVQVEKEVLDLLALESPVARDLRIILTCRDVAQIGELCLGLCLSLTSRAHRAWEVLSSDLRLMGGDIGDQTADVLDQANGAWSAIDDEAARAVLERVGTFRDLQTTFFTELVSLREVPVHAAVDLGLAVRVYERLTDHAADIAVRVIFAATGAPPVRAFRSPEV